MQIVPNMKIKLRNFPNFSIILAPSHSNYLSSPSFLEATAVLILTVFILRNTERGKRDHEVTHNKQSICTPGNNI